MQPKGQNQTIKFFYNFLASIVRKVEQIYGSLLQAPVGNFIAQPREHENQCLKSLAEFLRGNRTKLYFATKFSYKPLFSTKKKQAFSLDFENFEVQNTKKSRRSQLKKRIRHNYQAKML